MTEKTYNRHLSGIKGGQFAEKHQSEAPNVSLAGPPAVSPEFLAWRLDQHGYTDHLSPEHVEDIAGHLNESLDLSDKNIAKTANEVYSGSAGHSLEDAVAATAALARLREQGLGEGADAIERVISSRKTVADTDADAVVEALDDLRSIREDGYDHSVANSIEKNLQGVLDRNSIGTTTDELGQIARVKPATPEYDVFTVPESGRQIPVEKANPLPDGKSAPVPGDDPRLQAGEVFDKVESDWGTFHRRREGVHPGTPYAMRLQANRPLSDAEKSQVAGLVGYAYRSTIAGESLGNPESDSPYSFMVGADMTKSRRDDLGIALEEFEERFPQMIQEGSPVRSTNKSGPGTAGTRLVEGFNDPALKFEIYYDDVSEG